MRDEQTMTGENEFERDLAAALQYVDAPQGFADRLMARALAEDQAAIQASVQGPIQSPVQSPVQGPVQAAGQVANPFADKLHAHTAGSTRRGKVLAWPALRPWIGGAVAAALVAGLFATETAVAHHRAQERRSSQATAQFETTERITDHALEQARRHIAQAGVPLD